MSIDLSPFSAFALESVPPAAAPAEGSTLTLQLRAKHSLSVMTGTMVLQPTQAPAPNVQRAGVVAADATPLTITFE